MTSKNNSRIALFFILYALIFFGNPLSSQGHEPSAGYADWLDHLDPEGTASEPAIEFCTARVPPDDELWSKCVHAFDSGTLENLLDAFTSDPVGPIFEGEAETSLCADLAFTACYQVEEGCGEKLNNNLINACRNALAQGASVKNLADVFEEVLNPPTFTLGCSLKYTTGYILDIGVRPSNNQGATQGTCKITHNRSGLYGGGWGSRLTHQPGRKTMGNEVNYFFGRGHVFPNGVLIDGSIWFYDLANPRLGDGGEGDYLDYIMSLSTRDKCGDDKCPRRYYAEIHIMRGTGPMSFPDGWYVKGGVEFITANKFSWNLSGVHAEGITGGSPNDVLRLTVTPRPVGRFSFPVSYSLPLRGDGIDNEFWGTVAINF